MDLGGLNALGEAEVKRLLLEEGRKLERIARGIWQQYLDSYSPVAYKRTGKSMASIKLARLERLSADEWGIRLEFLDELAYHPSVMGGKSGHALLLISHGWHVSRGKHKDVYRFGYYEGFQFEEKIIEEYEKVKSPHVSIEFNWNGEYLR